MWTFKFQTEGTSRKKDKELDDQRKTHMVNHVAADHINNERQSEDGRTVAGLEEKKKKEGRKRQLENRYDKMSNRSASAIKREIAMVSCFGYDTKHHLEVGRHVGESTHWSHSRHKKE